MPGFDNEDSFDALKRLAPQPKHELGQSLDALSIAEIDERIALLRSEIERLEVQRASKEASRLAANAFFKA